MALAVVTGACGGGACGGSPPTIDLGEGEALAPETDEPLVGLDDARCGAGRAFDVRG